MGAVYNNYGVYIDAPSKSAGSMINNSGLYVADQSSYGSSSAMNVYSAGANSYNYFEGSVAVGGRMVLPSRTKAQLNVLTPVSVGETYYCSNCSPKKIVVSTGTAAGNFADAVGGTFQ